MFGTRTEGDAAAAKAAAPRLRELYRRERPRVGVGLELTLEEDGAKLAVRDADGNRAVVYGERQPQPGQKPPEEARAAYRRSLEKMGGTPFFPQEVAVRGAQWFLPGSEVNELRRRALESLLAKREQPRPIPCVKVPQALLEAPARAAKQEGYAVRLAHAAQLPRETPQDAAWFIMPLAQWRDVPPELRSRTWLEAPRALFGGAEEASARAAFESRDAGFAGYVAENIAQFTTLEGLPLAGGFGLNVTNPLSAKEYAALGARMLTLSPELTLEDIPAGKVKDYLLASAACFPALRAKQIDGVQFLDGGYRDNMPTALAQKMGAEELVCVDLEGVGITLPNRTGLPTTMIRSYWELGDILHFDPDTARRNMELGYYDTRRAMGYLRGCAYAVSTSAESCEDAAAFAWKFQQVQKAVREKYPVTLTADAALLLANMKDAQLAPLEAAAEDAGVDPTVFYTTRTLAEAFLEKCDRERIESFAPLFEGNGNAAQAARAALLPNTFLQALVCRALTGPVLPEVIEE